MRVGRYSACLLLAALPGLASAADICLGPDLTRTPVGATDVQILYADIPSARFPGMWQQGRLDGLIYRVYPGGAGMIGPAPRMDTWRIQIACDAVKRQCQYERIGSVPDEGQEVARIIGRCLLGPDPAPPPPDPQAAVPDPAASGPDTSGVPPVLTSELKPAPVTAPVPAPEPAEAAPQEAATSSPAAPAAAAPQAQASQPTPLQAGDRQPEPLSPLRTAPDHAPDRPAAQAGDSASTKRPGGEGAAPPPLRNAASSEDGERAEAVAPPSAGQNAAIAEALADDIRLNYTATQGTAVLPPLSRTSPPDNEDLSQSRLLPHARRAAASDPAPPAQPRLAPAVPSPLETLPARRQASPAPTPTQPTPVPVPRRSAPPRRLPPVQVVQAPPPLPSPPAVVQATPQPWTLSALALTRCTVSSAMALGREDIAEIGKITLSIGCAGRIGDRLTFGAALTTFPVHGERHGGKTTYSYSVTWSITSRVALTYANYTAALTGGRGLAGLGDGRLQLSAALPEFPLGTNRFPNRALRCSAFVSAASTGPVNGGVGCRVNMTDRLTLQMTVLAYPSGQQRRTGSDFFYSASYAFNDKMTLTYSNYGNNRWPWNRSSDSVELFRGGSIGLSYHYNF